MLARKQLAVGATAVVLGGTAAGLIFHAATDSTGPITCDGTTDTTATIQAALDTAGGTAGQTVTLPAGTCVVNRQLEIQKANAVTLTGQGANSTTLREVGSYGLLRVATDGSTVKALTLDASGV